MKTILIVCLTIVAFGCKSTKHVASAENPSKDTVQKNENVVIAASIGRIDQASDPISISDVRIDGNKMLIDVSYGGGCEEHQFQVIGSPLISKSLPPIRSIQLVHAANGDKCKMNVIKTLEVELKELAFKQEAGSKIYLTLGGWNQQIQYLYEK
ncbi:MAG: hypothetical protein RI922_2498 [Bacteroidota bacterium]|jgi:hypothetical protein